MRLPVKIALITLTASLLFVGAAAAQESVADFYREKTIRITVGAAAGGGNDTYARLVARQLSKYVPGNPSVIIQNIPGAGSNKAASYVALHAPRDGTAIGAIQPSAVLQPLLSDMKLPHDPSKFIALGSASSGVYLCLVRSDAPVKTFEEALSKEVLIGTPGEGSTLREMPILLVNLLGAKLKLIGGYTGSSEILVAIERNEVHGMCGMGYSSISMQRGEWLRNGMLRILVQEDMVGHPEVTKLGVPLAPSFAKTEEDRQVMEMLYGKNQFGRPFVLPEGVPPDRVAALRKAFVAAMRDPQSVEEAQKLGMDLGEMEGSAMQALVTRLYALPPNVIERAKQALIYKGPSK
jgi:tripartite-type tricarboxylate transporter receptor subunit TctC